AAWSAKLIEEFLKQTRPASGEIGRQTVEAVAAEMGAEESYPLPDGFTQLRMASAQLAALAKLRIHSARLRLQ
ncbi:MAG: hypothetical protein ABIH03_12075, partial [Pseudomonadota bacterium]